MRTLKALKAEILADPAVRREYETQAAEYAPGRAVVRARLTSEPTEAGSSWDIRPRPPHSR